MPDQNAEAENKLRKLGQRSRHGWTKEHPHTDKTLETVKQAVREQWEREQMAKRTKPRPGPGRARDRQPPEPDRES
jgi:hypothetical protein